MSRIYLGRLSFQARDRDVERFFRGYGKIREINLKNGFGFVEFDDPRDADDAVYDLNGRDLCGERVTVEHARGASRFGGGGGGGGYRDRDYYEPPRRRGGGIDKYGPPRRTDFRVIVENLSSRVSWQDLKDYMRQAGEVTFADAHKQSMNEGIVEFATQDDMESAIKKLDGTDLNGRTIKIINDSRGGSSRRRSRSRSRGRSRSKSRSRSRSKSASRSPRRSRSRSRSPQKSRSKSPSPRNGERSRSRSKSRSKSPAQEKN